MIIVELDRVLADNTHRVAHRPGAGFDWDRFLNPENMAGDAPLRRAIDLLRRASSRESIVILTEREERFRRVSGDWLARHGVDFCGRIVMRSDGDRRSPAEYKKEALLRLLDEAGAPVTMIDRDYALAPVCVELHTRFMTAPDCWETLEREWASAGGRPKTIVCQISGLRYDAIKLVDQWVELPAISRMVKEGILWERVYAPLPLTSPACTRAVLGLNTGDDRPDSPTFHKLLHDRGVVTASVGLEYRDFPCGELRVDFSRKVDDEVRLETALALLPHSDLVHVVLADVDRHGHRCRDQKRHVYSWESPYIWAVKQADSHVEKLIEALRRLAPCNGNMIVCAEHGMTDQGRHAGCEWTEEQATRVPVIATGQGFGKARRIDDQFELRALASGIVSLYAAAVDAPFFQHARA